MIVEHFGVHCWFVGLSFVIECVFRNIDETAQFS